MPQQSSPPYVGAAINQPRELQRWLDVNPQNGPLARTSTYIQLPIFTQSGSTWNGFSDVIFAYNVESPNNVGLLMYGTSTAPSYIIPVNPSYTLCISWRVGSSITRYVVWLATGTVLPYDVIPYAGQRLPKNWRFEIWNTSQGAVSNASIVTFYTTALGQIDYRYGSDSALVRVDAQSNNFACPASNAGMMGAGAGTPQANYYFQLSGTLNGRPSYTAQNQPLSTLYWDGTQWYNNLFFAIGHSGDYINSDYTNTPDGAGQFTADINTQGPGVTFTAVAGFLLPLTFPSNSVSTTN